MDSTLSSTWSIQLNTLDVRILDVGFDQWGVGSEIAGNTCLHTKCRKLTSAYASSYLLHQCDIEVWLIYYAIQHCLPIVVRYSWCVMLEGIILLMGWFFIFFAFSCDGHFFIIAFLLTRRIKFRFYMPFFCLWQMQKRTLVVVVPCFLGERELLMGRRA